MNPQFFRDLEMRRTRSIVDRDIPTIEHIHALDYELITPAGRVLPRARYLELIRTAPFYTAWEHGEMKVKSTSELAVVRYEARLTFPSGQVIDCWHTDIYEFREPLWLAVWSQATTRPNDLPNT